MWGRTPVRRRDRVIAGLCLIVTALVAAVSALGVFARGSGTTETVRSARGEVYEMVTDGVYAYNAERYVAEGFGWDLVTLFIVVPAMLVVLPALARGSLRGRLFALGVLGYFFYQYLMYAMSWAVGPLLLAYVAIYALSLVGIAAIASAVDLGELAASVTARFPRKGVVVLCAAIALLLPSMWIPRIGSVVAGELTGTLHGQTTMVVDAMDLGLLVPLAIATALLVWRARPVGYLLAVALVVKALAMATAISAMVLSAWSTDGLLDVGGLAIFVVAAAASLALAVKMFCSIRSGAPSDRHIADGPPPTGNCANMAGH